MNCTGFEMTQSPMEPGGLATKRNGVSVSVGVEMGVDKGEDRQTQLQRAFGGRTWQMGLCKMPRKSKSSTSLDGEAFISPILRIWAKVFGVFGNYVKQS